MTATRSATRVALLAGGAALLVAAAIAPAYQMGGYLPNGAAALPISAGIALLLAGAAWSTPLQSTGLWLALALVGQAASLQLVDAGTRLHYQHYLPWSSLTSEWRVSTVLLLMQLTVILFGLRAYASVVRAWIARELGGWRGAVLLTLVILMSATLNRDVPAYAGELVTSSLIQLVGLGNVLLVMLSIPEPALARLGHVFDRLLGEPAADGAPQPGGADRFAWSTAAIAIVLSAVLSLAVYERHPHVQDEVKYLLQARYYAHGMLSMPAPPVPDAFRLYLFEVGTRGWYSVITPGWPMVLAIGELLHVAWLINPLLTGLNIVLAYVLLRSFYDLRTTRIATVLLLLSPMHVFLGMSYMAQPLTLTCVLLAAVCVEWSRRNGRALYAWLAGGVIGFGSIVRQLDALVLALLLGLWAIGFGGKRLKLPSIAGLVLGTAFVAALIFPYNAYFTGKASVFPIMEYHDRFYGVGSNGYGFGPKRGMGWALDPNPGHGPVDATINANLNTTAMNVELFGWSVGSLVILSAFLLRGPLRRADLAMFTVIVTVFIAYFFNYFSGGPDFGARYWDLMSVPLVALTARGIVTLGTRRDGATEAPRWAAQTRAIAAAASLCAGMIVTFLPWRSLDKYHHYLNMRPDLRTMAFGRSLVLIRGVEYPDFASAASYNPLDLRADAPVFALDASPEIRRDLLRVYADRPVWIVDGPTRTKGAYRISAGPLTAAQLLSGGGPP